MSLPPLPAPAPTPQVTYCYRHPNREAGRACTRCGRPACGECLTPAVIGSHCPECVKAAKPDVRTRATIWNARQLTLVTYVIMAVNIAVFAWITAKAPGTISGRNNVSTQQCELGLSKWLVRYPGLCSETPHVASVGGYDWYRLVSAGFLHFGILHIAFNMLLLFQLGQLLERAVGRTQFTLLYVAALLGGSLGVLIIDSNAITGGASGAVFGLLAAAAVGLHRRGVNVFSTGIGTTLLLNLFLTFAIPGISIGGHIGGAIAGAICGFVMLAPKWKPLPRWAGYATPIAVAVAAVVASVVVVG